jgi:hypothetical protein
MLLVLPGGAPLEGGDAPRKPHQTGERGHLQRSCCRVISHIDLRMDLLIASVSWISLTLLLTYDDSVSFRANLMVLCLQKYQYLRVLILNEIWFMISSVYFIHGHFRKISSMV